MPETADFTIITPGMLEVLSVGKGDLKITVGGDDPEEIEKGRKVIEDMLRAGYSIFVETDKGPSRVKKFNPKRMTYSISMEGETEPLASPERKTSGEEVTPEVAAPSRKSPVRRSGSSRNGLTEVPVAGSRSTVVGRTAGG